MESAFTRLKEISLAPSLPIFASGSGQSITLYYTWYISLFPCLEARKPKQHYFDADACIRGRNGEGLCYWDWEAWARCETKYVEGKQGAFWDLAGITVA